MEEERIRISDADVAIGAPRLSIRHAPPPAPTSIDYLRQLTDIETNLLTEIARLQLRVEALERQTWWTLLRDWVRSLWRN